MFIAFLICMVAAAVLIVFVVRTTNDDTAITYGAFASICILGIMVLGIWSLTVYIDGVKDYGKLLVQEPVLQAGMIAIEATDKTVVKEPYNTNNKSIVGGIENVKQSSNTSERIKEYRDTVVGYEQLIGKYKALCSIWWYRTVLPGCLVSYVENLGEVIK